MEQDITFSQSISPIFRGCRQSLRQVGRWLNPKYRTPFWRVIWSVITVCIIAFTSMAGYAFYREFIRDTRYSWLTRSISPNYSFYDDENGKAYVFNNRTGRKTIKDIDWIRRSADGDSLMVFAKNGKRGYLNRYTGQVAIPAIYDAAWIFSDGVAGVCFNDSIFFIDHAGNPINSQKYPRYLSYDDYCYHGEYLKLPRNGKFGLVNRNGDWHLPPVYTYIDASYDNAWKVNDNGRWGVLNADGQFAVPCQFAEVDVTNGSGFIVVMDDHSKKRYDTDGTLIDDFLFDDITLMEYQSDEYTDDGNRVSKPAQLFKYHVYSTVGYHYGLMDRNGHPVTPQLYDDIEAVSATLYQCQIANASECILLNESGAKI